MSITQKKTAYEKLREIVMPSLLSGVTASAIYWFMYEKGNAELGAVYVKTAFLDLKPYTAIGAAVGLGAAGGEILTEVVLPWVQGSSFQMYEEYLIPPAMAAVGSVIAKQILIGGDEWTQVAILGGGSSVLSKYAANALGW